MENRHQSESLVEVLTSVRIKRRRARAFHAASAIAVLAAVIFLSVYRATPEESEMIVDHPVTEPLFTPISEADFLEAIDETGALLITNKDGTRRVIHAPKTW